MKTNLIFAFRNIKNNLINSGITVIGLSVAIACSLLIYFYVIQEYSYNKFYKDIDQIYRLNYKASYFDGSGYDVRLNPELAKLLPKEIPQIETCAEYRFTFDQVLKYSNNFYDAETGYANKGFFDVFSYDFIIKSDDNLFDNPNEIVLTKNFADNLLSDYQSYDDLLQKTLEFPLSYGNRPFKIVGVIKDIPKNSSIKFDALVSGESGNNFGGCDNSFGYANIYYKLKKGANAADAERNIKAYLLKYYEGRISDMQNYNQLVKGPEAFEPFALPYSDVYLEGELANCCENAVNKRNFVILITIGILILLIACCNYIILSLGQYMKKIGDVGIRKTMGANARNIFTLFFSEGFLLTISAFIAGSLLSIAFIPVFAKIANSEIFTELINIPKVCVFAAILFFGIVFFTSIIPVVVFSKISPQQISSKKLTIGNKSKVSQFFVSFQYSLAIILIIVTIFIVRQSNFLRNHALGIDTKNIIDIEIDRIDYDSKQLFADLLSEHSGVINLTKTSRNFMNGSSNSFVSREDGEQVGVYRFKVDENYISTLGLSLISGSDFNKENVKNTDNYIIVNQRFTEAFEIENNAVGKGYLINGITFIIKGVVADYHYSDMKQRIEPAALFARTSWNNGFSNLLLKYNAKQLTEVKKHIEECYEKVAPGKALTTSFWDERLNRRYESEERWSKIIGYASAIAIIISTLGLFGLTILLISQRVKEIGVRKVNGAKSVEVLITINKAFIGWLIGSLIIAIPIAYIIVREWLNNFPFKVEIDWWVFILSGFIALLIALFTVSAQSWKAARRNPVEALRYE